MVEVRRPPVQASSREFGIFSGSSGKAREVPARRISLSNHDYRNTLTWPEIQRLGRSEEAILVQRFDWTHAHKVAQELDRGSRGIHVLDLPNAPRSAAGARGSGFVTDKAVWRALLGSARRDLLELGASRIIRLGILPPPWSRVT